MAKFPTEVERSVTVKVPIDKAYKYLVTWSARRSAFPAWRAARGSRTTRTASSTRSARPGR